MTITVIIPNYNGSKIIKKNLPSVIKSVEDYKYKIIISDDFSDKTDYDELSVFIHSLIEQKIPVSLIRNKKNYGFSQTVNNAVSHTDSDLLILLNSDVIPERDFLKPVIPQFMNNPKLFAVGCMDKSIENNSVVLRGRGVGSFKKGFLLHRKGDIQEDNTLWVSGGSSIVRTEIFKKIGGFDILYNPFYWEDIDLSYRAQKSGYSILFNNKSIVEHRHEEGAIKKNFSDKQIKRIAYRNQFIFVWKNITDFSLLFQHIIYLPYHIVRAVINRDSSFLQGLYLAIIRLPKILQKRRKSKKLFVVTDEDILRQFA